MTVYNVERRRTSQSPAYPATSPEGSPITLTGHFTDPGSADTWTYNWTITDGNGVPYTRTGRPSRVCGTRQPLLAAARIAPRSPIRPDDNGTYVVTLTVTDNGGLSATSASVTTQATAIAPSIALSGNATVNEGSTYTLNLGAITGPR